MTRTNRLLLGVVLLTAAVAAFWFYALTPKREEAALLSEQIAAKQVELDTARQQEVVYEKARAAYPVNYATVARLGKAVPADDDVRSLMVQIDAAAQRTGVKFDLIDVGGGASPSTDAATDPATVIPGTIANAGGFSTLPMSFAFQGSYFGVSSFLTRLERFVTVSNRRIDVTGRLLLLQSISIVPDQEKGFPAMRAQINASSYLVPPVEQLAGAAEAAPATPAAGTTSSTATPGTTAATSTGAVR